MGKAEKGRKGGDFVPQNPDKLPKMLTPFFPGFHLIWQLFLIIFLCFFQNLPNIPTLLGPQLPGMWSRRRHRLRVHTTPWSCRLLVPWREV